jgi:hypothetical protein
MYSIKLSVPGNESLNIVLFRQDPGYDKAELAQIFSHMVGDGNDVSVIYLDWESEDGDNHLMKAIYANQSKYDKICVCIWNGTQAEEKSLKIWWARTVVHLEQESAQILPRRGRRPEDLHKRLTFLSIRERV